MILQGNKHAFSKVRAHKVQISKEKPDFELR